MSYVEHEHVSAFAGERVNLSRDLAQRHRDQVNRLRTALSAKIDEDADYSLVKMLHAGSVAKGTALRTVNDLDAAVYVRKGDAPGAESELVPWLADRLFDAAPAGMTRDQFVEQPHCVTVSYKGSGLDVDMVPVLYEGDENDRGYLVNRNTGARMMTSITQHLQFIRSRKSTHGGDYTQLIRLTKWWKRQAVAQDPDLKFKSFMMELLWARLADDGLDLSDYPSALEAFFQYIVKHEFEPLVAFTDFVPSSDLPARDSSVPIQVIDPVNPKNNVAVRYTTADVSRVIAAAQDAFDALSEARFATTKGRAVEAWQAVLGPSFKG